MKRLLTGAVVVFLAVWTAACLSRRWRDERGDRRVSFLVDWYEVRDSFVRMGLSDEELLRRLQSSGVGGILVSPVTLGELALHGRVRPIPSSVRTPLETGQIVIPESDLSVQVSRELSLRGVADATARPAGRDVVLVRTGGSFFSVKDIEVGYDPLLLRVGAYVGLGVVCRVNRDPWTTVQQMRDYLAAPCQLDQGAGVVFNTDDPPGGPEAFPFWITWLAHARLAQLLFEFHPTPAALRLAKAVPGQTGRAHTIAPAELKDLNQSQQLSRWRRAVEERSCRFLLFHVSPNDSLPSFLDSVSSVRQDFLRRGWDLGSPKLHQDWETPSFMERTLRPVLAFFVAILAPIFALRLNFMRNPRAAFIQIILVTLAGGCVVAAISDSPLTRLEIVPFRGIKAAFALAWGGCFLSLYSWEEIQAFLKENVRRLDIAAGLALAAIVGYVLVRMGNAGAGWKAGGEQSIRDFLENLLVARPRFKEFAVGYPLLWLGLHMRTGSLTPTLSIQGRGRAKRWVRDGRFLIALGMIGPISMVNTFCHLHSPLYLAFWRSANGIVLGTVLGFVLVRLSRALAKDAL